MAAADQRAGRGAAEQQVPATRPRSADDRDPVPPSASPRARRALADEPPCAPSVSRSPSRGRPAVRKGRTSTRSLRPTIRPPTTTSTTGSAKAAPPISASSPSDPAADVAAVPAGPEHGREEEAERDQDEPDELGVVVPAVWSSPSRALRLPHARGARGLTHAFRRRRAMRRSVRRAPTPRRNKSPGHVARHRTSGAPRDRLASTFAPKPSAPQPRSRASYEVEAASASERRSPEGAVEEVLAEVEEAGPEDAGSEGADRTAPSRGPRGRGRGPASSRYACATRTGEACTPARFSTGCHSTSSAAPGSPYHERPSAWSASSSSR